MYFTIPSSVRGDEVVEGVVVPQWINVLTSTPFSQGEKSQGYLTLCFEIKELFVSIVDRGSYVTVN